MSHQWLVACGASTLLTGLVLGEGAVEWRRVTPVSGDVRVRGRVAVRSGGGHRRSWPWTASSCRCGSERSRTPCGCGRSFNVAAAAIWPSGLQRPAFFWLAQVGPGKRRPFVAAGNAGSGTCLLLAALYFLLNSWLVAFCLWRSIDCANVARTVVAELSVVQSLNYFGGVSVAALMVSWTLAICRPKARLRSFFRCSSSRI